MEVPINVSIPPIIAKYDKGIKSFEAEIFISLANFKTIGIRTKTTGVLLMNADDIIVITISKKITNKGLFLVLDEIKSPTLSNTPVLTKAPDKTNIHIIVHGAGFERIFKNSLLGRTPKITIRTAVLKAVTSIGTISVIKKTIIVTSKIKEITTSKFSNKIIFLIYSIPLWLNKPLYLNGDILFANPSLLMSTIIPDNVASPSAGLNLSFVMPVINLLIGSVFSIPITL